MIYIRFICILHSAPTFGVVREEVHQKKCVII